MIYVQKWLCISNNLGAFSHLNQVDFILNALKSLMKMVDGVSIWSASYSLKKEVLQASQIKYGHVQALCMLLVD